MTPTQYTDDAGRTFKLAETVAVGDDILFLGKVHRVTSISEWTSMTGDRLRMAESSSTGWMYSLIPGEWVQVAS